MVESVECPQLKSNKMDLVGTAALAHSPCIFLSHSQSSSPSLHHTCPFSCLFLADRCAAINRGGTLLFSNGMPPTWAACLTESVPESEEESVERSGWWTATDTSAVCRCLHCSRPFAAERSQPISFEKHQHKWIRHAFNYVHTRFIWIPVLLPGTEGAFHWLTVCLNLYLIMLEVKPQQCCQINRCWPSHQVFGMIGVFDFSESALFCLTVVQPISCIKCCYPEMWSGSNPTLLTQCPHKWLFSTYNSQTISDYWQLHLPNYRLCTCQQCSLRQESSLRSFRKHRARQVICIVSGWAQCHRLCRPSHVTHWTQMQHRHKELFKDVPQPCHQTACDWSLGHSHSCERPWQCVSLDKL